MARLPSLLGELSEMEETAARIYRKGASAVKDDAGLERLMKGLALEEEEHMKLLTDYGGRFSETEALAALELDEEAVRRTKDYLSIAEKRIDAGRLTNENLIDCVATTESSEWNREFLKVIDGLKHDSRLFIPVAARIQQHKRSVERFLGSRSGFERFLTGMRSLPSVWEEKLLVVDDDKAVADVVTAVIEDEGSVETARNGAEALEKIASGYYAAIVSDFSMPKMNGAELLSKAEERFPGIKARFLFFTSDKDRVEHFRGKGVKALLKPSNASDISGEVASILRRQC
ncbi:Chemotaxis protein CheY [uncultured bacterium]|nr:Chemotaxis protein CheY [uncultured bacterium]